MQPSVLLINRPAIIALCTALEQSAFPAQTAILRYSFTYFNCRTTVMMHSMRHLVEKLDTELDWQILQDLASWTLDQALAIQRIPAPTFQERQRAEYRSEEHTSELQSRENLVCRLLLEKK